MMHGPKFIRSRFGFETCRNFIYYALPLACLCVFVGYCNFPCCLCFNISNSGDPSLTWNKLAELRSWFCAECLFLEKREEILYQGTIWCFQKNYRASVVGCSNVPSCSFFTDAGSTSFYKTAWHMVASLIIVLMRRCFRRSGEKSAKLQRTPFKLLPSSLRCILFIFASLYHLYRSVACHNLLALAGEGRVIYTSWEFHYSTFDTAVSSHFVSSWLVGFSGVYHGLRSDRRTSKWALNLLFLLFLSSEIHSWRYGIYIYMNFISLYCFLSVKYLNYISVFQLIALN
jgi:hypothetical protein